MNEGVGHRKKTEAPFTQRFRVGVREFLRMKYSIEATTKVRRWFDAARDPEIDAEVAAIHEEVAEAVRAAAPLCLASGQCCRFRENRIRLEATGIEACRCLLLTAASGRGIGHADLDQAIEAGTCPWNIDRLCVAREGRPSGCRVYYCDPRAKELVPKLQRHAMDRLQAIHVRHQLVWAFGEWREMLRGVMLVAEADGILALPGAPSSS